MTTKGHILLVGAGYTAQHIVRQMKDDGWQFTGTTRHPEKMDKLDTLGIKALHWDGESDLFPPSNITDIVISASPTEVGCPVLRNIYDMPLPLVRSILYLSSTGACGHHNGDWINEGTPSNTKLKRGLERLTAEQEWLAFGKSRAIETYVFRLSGIYGPSRNTLERLLRSPNKVKQIIKPGQYFNRIHVADIARTVEALFNKIHTDQHIPHYLFNLADDHPSPPQDAITYAAEILGITEPPKVPYEEAELTEMGRSFYEEVKRIKNDRVKETFDLTWKYPSYKEGLSALLEDIIR